jgi:predicted nucleic acid-binding protein
MRGNNETVYWDSCLFIAWLKDEQNRKQGEMDGVRDFVERLKKRSVTIITSTITMTEVTSTKVGAGFMTLFDDVLKRKNLIRVGVDIRIAKLAQELRDYYSTLAGEFNNKTLSVPDAIHLATAILYKADVFHTFDETNRSGTLGLIPLSGNAGGYPLVITKPVAIQPSLNLSLVKK